MFRAGREFQPLPRRDFDHRVLASHQLGVGLHRWQGGRSGGGELVFGQTGVRHAGEGLDYRRIRASQVAWTDGVHYWWKVLSYLTFVRICSII